MTLPFPAIDPIAFTVPVVDLPIRWYGLAYVAGFLAGVQYFRYALKRHPRTPNSAALSPDMADSLFVWIILGVILGGRLGYVLFYNFSHFAAHPLEIFQTWHGGMSYHGGMLGVFLAILLFTRLRKLNFFDISDRIAPGICFGLLFGRFANFINGELYGRVTDVPWAMVFPHDPFQLPRHPSQLYEAGLEGLVLFFILHLTFRKVTYRRFEVSGLFMLFYGLFRSFVELFRQPDALPQLQGGIFEWVTMGQVLSLPMIAVGIFLLILSRRSKTVVDKK